MLLNILNAQIIELNHIVFAFGHLNAIKYFKCSNNHKLKCLLLEIFQTVATVSCMIFGNALAFLIKPNTITENRKQEMEKREREI